MVMIIMSVPPVKPPTLKPCLWSPSRSMAKFSVACPPVKTRLPVHVDCRWELTGIRLPKRLTAQTNRGNDGSNASDDAIRGEWNRRLASSTVSAAYARLLSFILDPTFRDTLPKLTTASITTMDYYSLFPLQPRLEEPWDGMVSAFFAMSMQPSHPSWALYSLFTMNKGRERGSRSITGQFLRVLQPENDLESAVKRALCFGSSYAKAAHSMPGTPLRPCESVV